MSKKLKETYHRLGEIVVRKGAARPRDVDEALALQRAAIVSRKPAPRLGDILVERKVLDRHTIREILEEQKLIRGESHRLAIDLREHDDVAIVVLEGRLDETKQEHLTRVFERLMNRGFARLAVDCSRLVYINSHGVSSFVRYIDEARARGGDLKFFGLNPDTKFTLDRLGMSRFIQMFLTEDETIRAFDLAIDEYMSRGALGEYVAGVDSRLFHLSYCGAMQPMHDEDKVFFESKKHARDSGRMPCRKCRP
ncbi:MAG: STAS domain-containing protein [Planctomycetes bacterium]|nr:STAS domain-containing protein [Planctomycetota bacterium]